MKTIAVVSRKGGAGKSTLAAHLSVLADKPSKPALLIDVDPQGSLAFWHSMRAAETPILAQADPKDLAGILKDAEAEGIEWVIVDTMPHVEAGIARVVALADLCIVPTRPAAFDLAAVKATLDLIDANGKKAFVVLNAAPPKRLLETSTVRDSRGVLEGMGAEVWSGQISQRVNLSHAILSGASVSEIEPGGAAAREVEGLWKAIQKKVR